MAESVRAAEWTLTEHALDNLLLQLDGDRDRAGEKYERLRRKLIAFFEYRGCRGAEDCADDTITRVARRLEQGEAIQAPDPFWYFLGVARNVAREHHARRQREHRALDRQGPSGPLPALTQATEPGDDSAAACGQQCLQQLSPSERALIIDYYRGDTGVKIANRRRLAQRLQLAPNALRIRAHRIRHRLEACMRSCLDVRGGVK